MQPAASTIETPLRRRGALPQAALWCLPLLLCLAFFWRSLFGWFQQDDFAWLYLRLQLHSAAGLWRLLMEPRAEGTIRPLSERLFFIVFRSLFGLNAFPYHLFVLLTQLANLALLLALARRLTASLGAASLTAALWAVNVSLLTPMMWASAYNQILCAFFFLSSLLLFLKHVETGRWRFYAAQGCTFLLGFGAHESMAVFPLVLLAYCALLNRRHTWKAALLCIPSALYTAAHLWFIPRPAAGPYAFHLDLSVLPTLKAYWSWALGPPLFAASRHWSGRASTAFWVPLTLALGAAIVRAGNPQRRSALFGLAWFFLTLAPVVPLRDHRMPYYLVIPAIGLALAAGSVVSSVPRWAAAAWLMVYFGCSSAFLVREAPLLCDRSRTAKRFLEALRQARALHPDKTILLTGVSSELFYSVIYDHGPLAVRLSEVYLAPDSEGIAHRPGLDAVSNFELPARMTLAGLRARDIVVYDASGGNLKNVTSLYAVNAPGRLKDAPPRRIDLGEKLAAVQLGPGWYEHQVNHRWMGPRAEVRLAAPRSAGERLHIRAIYPDHYHVGTIYLTVFVNRIPAGRAAIHDSRSSELILPLPASVTGSNEMTVTLEAGPSFRPPGDTRDLSLAFGVVELLE